MSDKEIALGIFKVIFGEKGDISDPSMFNVYKGILEYLISIKSE